MKEKEKTILVRQATKEGFAEINEGGVLSIAFPESETRRGRVIDNGKISPTLDTGCQVGVVEPRACASRKRGDEHHLEHRDDHLANALTSVSTDNLVEDIRVRKLTPKECFRLQGFPDEYFERAASVCSDSQLYKQAGNSVTVNVIYEIARRLKI